MDHHHHNLNSEMESLLGGGRQNPDVKSGMTHRDIESQQLCSSAYDDHTARKGIDHVINLKQCAATPEQIELIKKWVQGAEESGKAYEAASGKFRCANKWIHLFSRIIMTSLGGGSVVNMFKTSRDDPSFSFLLCVAIISLLGMIFQTVESILAPVEKANSYHRTAYEYKNFARETRNTLTTGIDDRKDKVDQFMIMAENSLSNIETSSLPL